LATNFGAPSVEKKSSKRTQREQQIGKEIFKPHQPDNNYQVKYSFVEKQS